MDGTVAAWEISSGKRIMMAHAKLGLTTIVFVGNERVVTGTGEREAWIWPLNGQPPIPLTGHHDAITAIAANPYGDLVAIGDATGGVRLWGLHGELIGEAHDARGAVEELVFSPDQSLLLGGGADKRAYIWEIDSLALRRAVTAYQGAPGDPHYRNADHGLVWNADGSQFASVGSGEHRASVWRTPTGARVVRFWSRATTLAGQFAVTADDTRLVVQRIDTGVENPAIELAPPFPRPLDTLPKLGATWLDVGRDFIQVSRDSRQAMIWGPEIATLYALPKWAPLGDVPTTKANIGRLVPALTPDGKFVLELDATAARLVTAGVGTAVHELAIPGAVDGAIGPDDEHLVLVFGAQPPRMWRMSTGTEIPLHVHGGARHARFDPSGSRVVVYGEGAANVIDADTGATLATLGGSVIDDARFDRDGHRLATWARDHAAKLWNLETSSALVAVEGVPWRAFAVTDDGARFATGSDDGAIAIWDSATSRLLQVLHGERGLAGLAWSADGTRLLAKALGDRATIWDVHLEQRSPAEIAKLAEQASAWRLVDGQLVPRARP
jgi:WD40 repeat protein